MATLNDGTASSIRRWIRPRGTERPAVGAGPHRQQRRRYLTTAKDTQTQFSAFLEGRQNDLAQADTTETAVRLQTDSQALQISYASLAKITQLSLLNYL